ncbi:hypothetical protein HDU92_003750 [Lobulomyces angularis]|nr:hypothetical protein HDU92_003750 [Lobulomyces angularis]
MGQESNAVLVIFSVSFYIITAIILVMVNKAVLNKIEFPLTFLTLQILVSIFSLKVFNFLNFLPPLKKIEGKTLIKLMPLFFINVLGLSLNTLCLKFVDASFYQVARSLVLPFTVVFTKVILKQSSSILVLLSCLMVCSGFLVGTKFDPTNPTQILMNNKGVYFGILSSITTSLHAIIIKKSLNLVEGKTFELVYYNNLFTFIGLIPVLILNGEIFSFFNKFFFYGMIEFVYGDEASLFSNKEIIANELTGELGYKNLSAGTYLDLKVFILGSLVTGVFGFLINVAGFLQIKVTSPVSHMISSAVRGVIQTILAIIIFGDSVTEAVVIGTVLILTGSSLYTLFKSWEQKSEFRLTQSELNKKDSSRLV